MYDSSKSSRTRRDVQARETRERLIDGALTVFGEKGVAGATIKGIAEAARTSPGLLYHYFRDKEELLQAVFERHGFLPQLRELLSVLPNGTTDEVLRQTALRFSSLLAERGAFVNTMVGEAQSHPEVSKVWGATVAEGIALLSRYLDSRVAAGELRPHRTEVTARTLMSTVLVLHLTQISAKDVIPDLIENLLNGVRVT